MKVNLEKELRNKKAASQLDVENFVQDVKLLMDGNAKAERDALTFAGLDTHIVQVETAKGVELERESFENTYNGKVFTLDEIKHVCLKYDLRFLRASRFAGTIDQNVAVKLAQFRKNNAVGLGNNESNRFFIMAPSSSFNLDDRPEKVRPPKGDPLLFYKINESNYLYLHKWGMDFTLFRRFMGIFYKSMASMLVCSWSIWFMTIMLFRGLLGFGVDSMSDFWGVLGLGGLCLGLAPLTLLVIFWDDEKWLDRTTKETWDSSMRRSKFPLKKYN